MLFLFKIKSKQEIKEEKDDSDYEPEEIDLGNETPPSNPSSRKSRYKADSVHEEVLFNCSVRIYKIYNIFHMLQWSGNTRNS